MRVLLVSHRYPPNHHAGTEVYTEQLALHLKERGHEVWVLCSEKDVSLPNLTVREREHNGVAVVELVNNLFFDEFEKTYNVPKIDRFVGGLVERLKIDVVHFNHALYLSAGAAREVSRRNCAVLFSLHDYWLQCPRMGQRVHVDGSICHTIDLSRCGGCMAQTKWKQSRTEERTARLLTGVRKTTGLDLAPVTRASAELLRRSPVKRRGKPQAQASQSMTAALERRAAFLERELVPYVDRFLAPSRFLRSTFLEWGLSEDQCRHVEIGLDLDAFRPFPKTPSDVMRVTFLGTLQPLKGAHVLIEAWGKLPAELRAQASLALHGPDRHHPQYVRELREAGHKVGARFAGTLDRVQVAEAFRSIDLLVVPSVWYENSPLTILEARATGTPVVASALGGMQELVVDGGFGSTFAPGDSDALAAELRSWLEDRERLQNPPAHLVRPPSGSQHAEVMESIYEEILSTKL